MRSIFLITYSAQYELEIIKIKKNPVSKKNIAINLFTGNIMQVVIPDIRVRIKPLSSVVLIHRKNTGHMIRRRSLA